MLLKKLPRDILRQDVRWVVCTRDFVEDKITIADMILHPQISGRKVPHFAETSSLADADSCGSIGADSQVPGEPKIGHHTSHAYALACASAYASQLGFCGGECDCSLCLTPMAQQMLAMENRPS